MTQPHSLHQLDAGSHWICTCGLSNNFPYCNGAHKGTEFQPLNLVLEAPATVEISGSARVAPAPSSL